MKFPINEDVSSINEFGANSINEVMSSINEVVSFINEVEE